MNISIIFLILITMLILARIVVNSIATLEWIKEKTYKNCISKITILQSILSFSVLLVFCSKL